MMDAGDYGDGAQRALTLLVVDVQEAAVDLRPFRCDEVLANISTLVAACRSAAVPVIFVQHDGEPGEPNAPHTPGWEIHAPIAPRPGETVVRKRFNSAFRDTGLHDHLQAWGTDMLIVVGIQTEYCVDTTVRVAFELGYSVLIPEMTNSTYDNGDVRAAEIHELFNRRIFHGRFASVVSIDDTLQSIGADSGGAGHRA